MRTVLTCQIRQRLPVGLAILDGTLDSASAVGAVVSLRDCLAAAPSMLLLDVRQLAAAPAGLAGLLRLAVEAHDYLGTRVAFCGPSAALRAQLGEHPAMAVELYRDLTAALAAARALTTGPRLSVHLAAAADAPRRARRGVARACALWGSGGAGPVAELIASELVTNAVVHARTPSLLTIRWVKGSLQLGVRDGDPRPAAIGSRAASLNDPDQPWEHGRGLRLLEALAQRWGSFATADGKVVWAWIAAPGPTGFRG